MKRLWYDATALGLGLLIGTLAFSTVTAAQRGQAPPPRPTPAPAGRGQTPPAPRRAGQTADDTFHIPYDQRFNACVITWDQAVGANAPDSVDTVNSYTYTAITDGIQPGAPVSPLAGSKFCTGTASPYPCAANYTVPPPQATVGNHTLTMFARDTSGQLSPSTSIPFVIDPPVVGPPPAPANLRFRTGGGTAKP